VTRLEIPQELRRFILTSIPSVPYVEAVLLLRAEPDRGWSTAEVARRLYLAEARAQELVEQLVASGVATTALVEARAGCRFAPRTPELAAMLDMLARWYAAELVAVTDLIHSKIDRKALQFADAFRWRKDS
jgi:hypothetical protein